MSSVSSPLWEQVEPWVSWCGRAIHARVTAANCSDRAARGAGVGTHTCGGAGTRPSNPRHCVTERFSPTSPEARGLQDLRRVPHAGRPEAPRRQVGCRPEIITFFGLSAEAWWFERRETESCRARARRDASRFTCTSRCPPRLLFTTGGTVACCAWPRDGKRGGALPPQRDAQRIASRLLHPRLLRTTHGVDVDGPRPRVMCLLGLPPGDLLRSLAGALPHQWSRRAPSKGNRLVPARQLPARCVPHCRSAARWRCRPAFWCHQGAGARGPSPRLEDALARGRCR
jgi:hypothetical protein